MLRVVTFLLLLLNPLMTYAASQVKFVAEIPAEQPMRLSVGPDGKMFITNQNGNVVIAETNGKTLLTLNNKNENGVTILKKPTGIALWLETIYVTDKSLDKIALFSKTGVYQESISRSGSGPGELSNPQGIFVNQGVIYVADYSNDRIQIFGPNGVFLSSIGYTDDRKTTLKKPTEVAVGPNGYIYVIDSGNKQVKIFKPGGDFAGTLEGLANPKSLAIASDGIFVADQEYSTIFKFTFNGERILSFGSTGDGRSQFTKIAGIAIDILGNLHVAETEKGIIKVIATEKSAPVEGLDWAPPPTSVRWLKNIPSLSSQISWDPVTERLYTINNNTNELLVNNGEKIEQTVKVSDWNPVSVKAVQGGAWVVDRSESRVIKLDSRGKQLLQIGSYGSKPGQLARPRGVTVSEDGMVYVADTGNDRIQTFNGDGVFLNVIGTDAGIPELRNPTALAVDEKGNLYIISSSVSYIQRVSPDGKVLGHIGESTQRQERLNEPVDLAIIGNELFVLDTDTCSIKVYDLEGKFLRTFGAKGDRNGEFRKPSSLTVVDGTKIMVADFGNNRIQLLGMVHTPLPINEPTATAGMRSIDLSWKKSQEPFTSAYRIFRAKEKPANFEEIASVKQPSFQDRNLEPLVSYFYKISAVACDGNNAIASNAVMVMPTKYRTVATKGFVATSMEWSVDLRWEPNQENYADRYLIYRKEDNDKGVFQLVGETRSTSFSDGKLESDSAYVYDLSVMSIDGLESDKTTVKVKTLVATKPPLQIDVIKLSNIFSNTYKIYENEGIGKILLTNNTGSQIDSLKLAFTIKSYMDFPSELEIKNLLPRSSREIPLKAVFNNRILEVSEDTPLQAEIMVTYYENQKPRTFSKSHTVTLYEKHRMMWLEKDRVATFITSKDPVLLEFTRSIVTQYGDISSPLVYASAIFDNLGHMGMTYLLHPTNPYQVTEGKTAYIDYVQYPRDTLKRNSGVCTDLVVLFSAAMESLGVRTVLLGIPGHLFTMFALGPVDEIGNDTMGDMLVIHDGLLWVPVEMTTVGSPFMKAWEEGSKTYNENMALGAISYTAPSNAWVRYKPATLAFSDWRVPVAPRSAVDKHYNNEIDRISKIALKYQAIRYFEILKKNPDDYSAMMQIGIIYGESGEVNEAQKYFEKANVLSPDNAVIRNNLGNIHFLKGEYKEALSDYQLAAEIDPADPYILVNLTKIYLRLDQRDKAAEAFRKAIAIDREISHKYRAIVVELMGSL